MLLKSMVNFPLPSSAAAGKLEPPANTTASSLRRQTDRLITFSFVTTTARIAIRRSCSSCSGAAQWDDSLTQLGGMQNGSCRATMRRSLLTRPISDRKHLYRLHSRRRAQFDDIAGMGLHQGACKRREPADLAAGKFG